MIEGYKQAPSTFQLVHINKAMEEGLVILDKFNKPCCKNHGAMNAVKKDCTVYRCSAFGCGLGIKTIELQEKTSQ